MHALAATTASLPRFLHPQSRREFPQRLSIDFALERYHLRQGIPVAHPAPLAELRIFGVGEVERLVAGQKPQQEPLLLLAAEVPPRGVVSRQAVAQPAGGAPAYLHRVFGEAGLLAQFSKQRLLHAFVRVDAALGKLPPFEVDPAPPEHLAARVVDYDAHVRTKAVAVHVVGSLLH